MRDRLKRQSFLGDQSNSVLAALRVGIVGLGGGGSHIAQQLGHIGVGHFTLVDHDRITETNLNRLVGGTARDVAKEAWKTHIAARQIKRIMPGSHVNQVRERWQLRAECLRECDVVFGCVDSFAEREQLEAAARRYMTPYIDIGMDVFPCEGRFAIAGQIALSMPGQPCMHCMGIIRNDLLAHEAANYGAAGDRPQVVWPNGILASLAVSVFMQLVTPWHEQHRATVLLEYDGNTNEVRHSAVLLYTGESCPHFQGADALGDPWYHT